MRSRSRSFSWRSSSVSCAPLLEELLNERVALLLELLRADDRSASAGRTLISVIGPRILQRFDGSTPSAPSGRPRQPGATRARPTSAARRSSTTGALRRARTSPAPTRSITARSSASTPSRNADRGVAPARRRGPAARAARSRRRWRRGRSPWPTSSPVPTPPVAMIVSKRGRRQRAMTDARRGGDAPVAQRLAERARARRRRALRLDARPTRCPPRPRRRRASRPARAAAVAARGPMPQPVSLATTGTAELARRAARWRRARRAKSRSPPGCTSSMRRVQVHAERVGAHARRPGRPRRRWSSRAPARRRRCRA